MGVALRRALHRPPRGRIGLGPLLPSVEVSDEMNDDNRRVVERLIACINDRNIAVMDELFHDDAVMDWPQSGEKVRGADNRRAIYGAFPQLPTITTRRIISSGDLVVTEASLDYDGPVFLTVFIFEFRDGKIARETAYWSDPFEAPAWRSEWVDVSEVP
jgi:ketosteroid isomerase-like protein